jgi:hypothetical protein
MDCCIRDSDRSSDPRHDVHRPVGCGAWNEIQSNSCLIALSPSDIRAKSCAVNCLIGPDGQAPHPFMICRLVRPIPS